MPQIFYCDMENFEHLYEECVFLLSPKRREKAEKLINKNDALLSATAGLMMKKALKIENDDMIELNEHGKPFTDNGLYFNISHSRRFSMLAVSENEIGIDIEMHETPRNKLIEHCFTKEEQAFAKMSTENFLRVWTAKEAVLKFLGTGFSFSPKKFSVFPFDEEHEVNGKKFKFFCSNIKNIPFTVAFSGDGEFNITELYPEDIIY